MQRFAMAGDDTGHYEMLKRRAAEQLERDDLSDAVKARIKGGPVKSAVLGKSTARMPQGRSPSAGKPPFHRKIIKAVSLAWDIPEAELLGEKRGHRQSRPRFALYWLLQQAGMSLPQIGKLVNRDHTSALLGTRHAQRMFVDEADWRYCYQRAQAYINSPPSPPLGGGEGVAHPEGTPDSGPAPSPKSMQEPESTVSSVPNPSKNGD